ncbi:hypothetical protein SDC9_206882 [bioreactor metagenome]|uniref:Uncharacterized protein n=1 Tax=bioreactor metagenome TaxID=1076179 RepID=A0A645J7Q0_9ZZZZ
MLPTHQGLDPDHPAAGHFDLGLVGEEQLALGQGMAQVVFQSKAVQGLGVHFRGEEAEAAPFRLFGVTGGGVGIPQQARAVPGIVGEQADPGADRHLHRLGAQVVAPA